DLDVHGDLLDVFDVVRLVRRAAWRETGAFDATLQRTGMLDVRRAAAELLRPRLDDKADTAVRDVQFDERQARVTFEDGSAITIPRQQQGRITEIEVGEGIAGGLMTSTRSIRGLGAPPRRLAGSEQCEASVDVVVNQVFFRREPHMMRRYLALAADNIRADPV